jgi:hypothetical protein
MALLSRLIIRFSRERLDRSVQSRLKLLRKADRGRRVFGASRHGYNAVKATPEEVAELEKSLGVALPLEFREHLLGIGYGAGPYYGLFAPVSKDDKWSIRGYLDHCGTPARPFPYSVADARSLNERLLAKERNPFITVEDDLGGCITIAHQGCDHWTLLVVEGECTGTVWDLCDGYLSPSCRPPGILSRRIGKLLKSGRIKRLPDLPSPPTFNEWYSGWLEKGLHDVVAC